MFVLYILIYLNSFVYNRLWRCCLIISFVIIYLYLFIDICFAESMFDHKLPDGIRIDDPCPGGEKEPRIEKEELPKCDVKHYGEDSFMLKLPDYLIKNEPPTTIQEWDERCNRFPFGTWEEIKEMKAKDPGADHHYYYEFTHYVYCERYEHMVEQLQKEWEDSLQYKLEEAGTELYESWKEIIVGHPVGFTIYLIILGAIIYSWGWD